MIVDHDFHPDESTVRVFRTPATGVLRLDEDVVVTEAKWAPDVVLRHYAFARHWFKVNVTTDLQGRLMETGDAPLRFTFNCDVATTMERDGNDIYGVDLFVDVLVRADATAFVVTDEDELGEMTSRGLVSPREATAARNGLAELLELVAGGRLVPWLHEIVPFGPCDPPDALPMERVPIPDRLRPGARSTW